MRSGASQLAPFMHMRAVFSFFPHGKFLFQRFVCLLKRWFFVLLGGEVCCGQGFWRVQRIVLVCRVLLLGMLLPCFYISRAHTSFKVFKGALVFFSNFVYQRKGFLNSD